ncbi:BnaC02g42400D [Brassica napus]|uniref:BnaC02g42400D protein n=1 Tax=Brassica napus TaxID=3708 RepID=A0A078I6J2_BRANA|nr:BnaC02g42400D [Brassica napus]
MGLMVTSRVSESLLLFPPPPEPPLSALPLDLLGGIPAPDPPDPPDPPDMFGESDLSSLPCLCFTLPAARSHLFNCTITACSVCLLLVTLRVKLVRHLLLSTAGCRSWIYDFVWGNDFSMFLSLFSKGMFLRSFRHLVCLTLPQYEVLLPQYEVVVQNLSLPSIQYFCMLVVFSNVSGILLLRKIGDGFKKANLGSLLSDLFVCPWWFLQLHTLLWLRISSQFQGSSKRCMITFVAKLLAAFYAFVAAACSDSSSPSVASDFRGVISSISTRGSLLSCLCVMFAYIYVYVTCFACDAAVSLASLVLLYYLLNDYSSDGV